MEYLIETIYVSFYFVRILSTAMACKRMGLSDTD